jgi:hypothetical protein
MIYWWMRCRAAHHHIEEVYPFLGSRSDKAMGLAPTRLAICSFIYGVLVLHTGWWIILWSKTIGILVESQVLVILKICQHLCLLLEMTVFFGASIGYYFLYEKQVMAVQTSWKPDVRTTDDHLMEVANHNNEEELAFKSTGARS